LIDKTDDPAPENRAHQAGRANGESCGTLQQFLTAIAEDVLPRSDALAKLGRTVYRINVDLGDRDMTSGPLRARGDFVPDCICDWRRRFYVTT